MKFFNRKRKSAPAADHKPAAHFVWHNLDTGRSSENNAVVREWIAAGYRLHVEVLEY